MFHGMHGISSRSLWFARWTLAVGLLGGVLSFAAARTPDKARAPRGETTRRTDCYGHALPDGALARLGTIRFRHVMIRTLAYSPDGKHIASGGADGLIRLWDAASGREVRAFRGHPHWISALCFSPDGRLLLSCGEWTGRLFFWDVASGKLLRTCLSAPQEDHAAARVHAFAFAPTGKVVASVDGLGLVHCWEAATGKHLRICAGRPGIVRSASVAFSPDGKKVAAGDSRDGTVRLWVVGTGKLVRSWKAHEDEITAIAFSPDGKALATGDRSALRLWDVATGKKIRGWGNGARGLAFSPNGKILAAVNVQDLELWDPATGKPLCRSVTKSGAFFALAFAPDGRTIACGGDDNLVSVYDLYFP